MPDLIQINTKRPPPKIPTTFLDMSIRPASGSKLAMKNTDPLVYRNKYHNDHRMMFHAGSSIHINSASCPDSQRINIWLSAMCGPRRGAPLTLAGLRRAPSYSTMRAWRIFSGQASSPKKIQLSEYRE
jgi:hypothetical protein